MSTSIFTFTHKKFTPPSDQTYIPMQVGAATNPDLGYLSDATGDNISELNKFYGELTGMYWIWRNYTEADFIGMCHYRRYFVNEQYRLMTEADVERILSTHDVILSNKIQCNKPSYFEDFADAHDENILRITGDVIRDIYPEYYETYNKVFSEGYCHFGNLMIMPHHLFNQYAAWLFNIFSELEPRLRFDFKDLYHQRIFGFISENLVNVWTRHNNLSVYESNIGITSEKIETKEFKLAMTQLFKMRQTEEASKMFYEYTKLRPDIRLPQSDLSGEIPIIEHLIYICNEEAKDNLSNTLDFSTDLTTLIKLYRFTKDAIIKKQTDEIMKNNISWYMVCVIIMNGGVPAKQVQEYLEFYGNLYNKD
ncbi:MAG: DUF4422 domain-containing protein [Eubacteriales bacterium]|nr:DUF4422 domain-containing protein [Eubacteriales bacterium]